MMAERAEDAPAGVGLKVIAAAMRLYRYSKERGHASGDGQGQYLRRLLMEACQKFEDVEQPNEWKVRQRAALRRLRSGR